MKFYRQWAIKPENGGIRREHTSLGESAFTPSATGLIPSASALSNYVARLLGDQCVHNGSVPSLVEIPAASAGRQPRRRDAPAEDYEIPATPVSSAGCGATPPAKPTRRKGSEGPLVGLPPLHILSLLKSNRGDASSGAMQGIGRVHRQSRN
jgi:hypothetical protein